MLATFSSIQTHIYTYVHCCNLTVLYGPYLSFSPQQRRKEHETHIRQQEEELLQKEMEFKERQRRQKEEEEKRKRTDTKQNSLSDNLQYDYNINYPGYMEYERQVQSPDSMQESDSSGSVLSPVPGSTIWESDICEVDLLKGEDGLGFSILDFAVSC